MTLASTHLPDYASPDQSSYIAKNVELHFFTNLYIFFNDGTTQTRKVLHIQWLLDIEHITQHLQDQHPRRDSPKAFYIYHRMQD